MIEVMNTQLNLMGESKDNEGIREEIREYQEGVDECRWVLNGDCDWNDYEKGQWWMSRGGELTKALEEEIKEQINFLEGEIGKMKKRIIEREWV